MKKSKDDALVVEVMKDMPSPDEMDGEEDAMSVDGPGQLAEMQSLLKSGDKEGAWEVFQDLVASCK